jgi:hypothetical protein
MLKKFLKIALIVGMACLASVAFYLAYGYISKLPKKVINFEGVALGMDMSEVKYILGYPDSVLYPVEDFNKGKGKPMMAQMLATKEQIERSANGVNDFYDWQFNRGAKRIDIGFDSSNNKVNSIGCYVDAKDYINAGTCAVNNIQALDSEEVILEKLGKPSSSIIDNSTKTITYNKYNLKINLVKKTAYYIIVEELN